jgi:hypothetical protein
MWPPEHDLTREISCGKVEIMICTRKKVNATASDGVKRDQWFILGVVFWVEGPELVVIAHHAGLLVDPIKVVDGPLWPLEAPLQCGLPAIKEVLVKGPIVRRTYHLVPHELTKKQNNTKTKQGDNRKKKKKREARFDDFRKRKEQRREEKGRD